MRNQLLHPYIFEETSLNHPAARELERITTLHAGMMPSFYTDYPRQAKNPAYLAYGLLLSEYRLSIFAPALAQKGRASVKKLQAAAETLR